MLTCIYLCRTLLFFAPYADFSEKTIERKSKELLAFTTILKYKGLEDNNIILVIPASKIKSSWDNFLFEIYVGMTRAIMNLDIIILKSN